MKNPASSGGCYFPKYRELSELAPDLAQRGVHRVPDEFVFRALFNMDDQRPDLVQEGFEWVGLMWYNETGIDVYQRGSQFRWVWADKRGCKVTHEEAMTWEQVEDFDGPHFDTLKVKLNISQC